MAAAQRVVLVTGASSGIGLSCAVHLARSGYRVYGASRSAADSADRTDGVLPLVMDVTQDESVRQACAGLLEREGRLDVLINSAGMGIAGALEDTSLDEARRQFDVNLFGVLRVCRAALPAMRKQESGYIVNIGSIGGLVAIPYQGMYSASKFALGGLTECLRMEVKSFGIRVVLIEPGDHATGFTKNRVLTQASSENPVYRVAFTQAIRRMATDEQKGPHPDQIARLAHRVIETRHPRLRYTTGPGSQRLTAWLKRFAPNGLVEKIVSGYYGR